MKQLIVECIPTCELGFPNKAMIFHRVNRERAVVGHNKRASVCRGNFWPRVVGVDTDILGKKAKTPAMRPKQAPAAIKTPQFLSQKALDAKNPKFIRGVDTTDRATGISALNRFLCDDGFSDRGRFLFFLRFFDLDMKTRNGSKVCTSPAARRHTESKASKKRNPHLTDDQVVRPNNRLRQYFFRSVRE